VTQNHRRPVVAGQQTSAGIHKRAAQSRARSKHEHATRGGFLNNPGLCDAGEQTVVGGLNREIAPGLPCNGPAQILKKIPPFQRGRHVGHFSEDSMAEVGAGHGQTDACHVTPRRPLRFEKFRGRLDPAPHNGRRPFAGARVHLPQPAADQSALRIHRADFGRRRTAVNAKVKWRFHALTRMKALIVAQVLPVPSPCGRMV